MVPGRMRRRIALLPVLGLLVVAPAAEAATTAIAPAKKCYRSGEKVVFGGTGFTPNNTVRVTSNGVAIPGGLTTNPVGTFLGRLTVGQRSGEQTKTYQAIDNANPTITAATAIKVSALNVGVKPKNGNPGRKLRIKARGFTSGGTLRAHVVKGRFRRNIRIGKVKGACGKVTKRKRIFRSSTRSGTYTVQFDTKRRYSRKTAVRIRYRVTVFRRLVSRSVAASSVGWTRLP